MSTSEPKKRLDAVVKERFELSWGKARSAIETGKIWLEDHALTDPALPIAPSAPLELKMNAPRPRAQVEPKSRLDPADVVFSDSQLIVVNKRAGVSTVPYEEGEQGTLEQLVCAHLGQSRVVVVHRLDRETSGLIVFARTQQAGKALANQFRFHTVKRRYFALAQGEMKDRTIRSLLVENRGDGLRGSVRPGSSVSRTDAKEAVTHIQALSCHGGFTLVECHLETGRTHQIRIHLAEAGHPLLGEKAYDRDYRGPKVEAPRILLHAAELGFVHPTRETPMHWTRLPPEDFLAFLPPREHELLEARLRT